MAPHLTWEEWESFLLERLPLHRKQEMFRHLMAGCPKCQEVAGRGFYFGRWTPSQEENYEEVVASVVMEALRAERRRQDLEQRDRALALLATGEGLAALIGIGGLSLNGLGVMEALLTRCWSVRHDNPKEMKQLAYAAVQAALSLDVTEYGESRVMDYKAQAYGQLGNALRVAEEYEEAARQFGNAFRYQRQGTGDELLKANLHNLHASLLGTRRKFEHGIYALEIAYEIYLENGDSHLAGRSLIKKAIYTFYNGQAEEALRVNQKGRMMIDPLRDPEPLVTALHNDLLFLEGCGRFSEAKSLLFKNRDLLNRTGKITRLKLRWAEARIELAMNNLVSAEQSFSEVREGMIEESLGFNASLASLELALVWMSQGRAEEAKEIVHEAAEIFYNLGMHVEVLGAVQLLVDAFRFKKASTQLIQRTISFIREWTINPDARFLPSNE